MVDTTNKYTDFGDDKNEFKNSAEQWGNSLLKEINAENIVIDNTSIFSFATTYKYIKEGKKVSRQGWNNRHIWIILYNQGNNHYRGFEDFIVMMTTEGKYVPWTPSQTDLLTEDWILI